MSDWQACGLGLCAAEDGHEGTCVEASGFQEPDPRDYSHVRCDCVPDLGPAHCHLCSGPGWNATWPCRHAEEPTP